MSRVIPAVYPEDALALNRQRCDAIDVSTFKTIPEVFAERVNRSPGKVAFVQYDDREEEWKEYTWKEMADTVRKWRSAFAREKLEEGSRVAVMLQNAVEWIAFDQAALAESLVVVPVFVEDRAENIAYILEHTESNLVFLQDLSQWETLSPHVASFDFLKRVVVVEEIQQESSASETESDGSVLSLSRWLDQPLEKKSGSMPGDPQQLATIVYTSGTTGKPKGVMLSHANMLQNAYAGLQSVAVFPEDRFLSFLPLSHMFERTVGYYLPLISGAEVAFNRSIPELAEDLQSIRPTVMITVPKIFERVQGRINSELEHGSKLSRWLFNSTVAIGWSYFLYQQGRGNWSINQIFRPILNFLVARKISSSLGGRMRVAICGGAKLGSGVSKMFIGLGVNILQGYGLTESSPVISVNTLDRNKPESIGLPFNGVEIRLGELDELQVRSAFTMLGYWKNAQATEEAVDKDGWLHTGDIARVDDQGFIHITGRLKEIIVLANGEKIPPADMESAISDDPLFDQVMVVGEGRDYLTALVVLNPNSWEKAKKSGNLDGNEVGESGSSAITQFLLDKIAGQLQEFPGYAFVRNVFSTLDPWTVENGLITPTLKLKRGIIADRYADQIEEMYDQDNTG